jgi:molecular chaperone DnaJ
MEIVVPRPVACPACDGTGRKNGAPCGACGGAGRVVRDEAVAFDLPERVARRARLRLVGRGEQGVRGGADGDLVIDVTVDTPGGEER